MTPFEAARNARHRAGLTLHELATLSGVNHAVINHFELGAHYPRYFNIARIADALDITVDQYLGLRRMKYFWEEREEGESISRHIRWMRHSRFLAQKELAEAADVSVAAIRAMEQDAERCLLSSMLLVADALGVTLDELVGNPAPYKKRRAGYEQTRV